MIGYSLGHSGNYLVFLLISRHCDGNMEASVTEEVSLSFFSDADLLTVKYPVPRNFACVLSSWIQLTGVICPATWSKALRVVFITAFSFQGKV